MAKSKSTPKAKAEAPKSEPEAKKPSLKKTKVWNCDLYIRDFGRVNEGEECTVEALEKLHNADQYVK